MFVFPTLCEGFGLPIIEAMACGTPVLTSDIPSLQEITAGHAKFFDPEKTEQIYETIEYQVIYMDKIVTDLQDFSRKISLKKQSKNLEELINEVFSSISTPENIEVNVNKNTNTPFALVDSSSMKRVIDNLVLNAIQAMPEGGKLKVAISSVNKEIIVTVEDTGVGIPKECLDKIFEPFFTTKAQGQGLGLSICKKFVEANGGSIKVESTAEKGTKFIITLNQV